MKTESVIQLVLLGVALLLLLITVLFRRDMIEVPTVIPGLDDVAPAPAASPVAQAGEEPGKPPVRPAQPAAPRGIEPGALAREAARNETLFNTPRRGAGPMSPPGGGFVPALDSLGQVRRGPGSGRQGNARGGEPRGTRLNPASDFPVRAETGYR